MLECMSTDIKKMAPKGYCIYFDNVFFLFQVVIKYFQKKIVSVRRRKLVNSSPKKYHFGCELILSCLTSNMCHTNVIMTLHLIIISTLYIFISTSKMS